MLIPAEDVLLHTWQSAPASRDQEDIQELIDSVIAQQAGLERTAPPPIDIDVHPAGIDASITETEGPAPGIPPEILEAAAPPAALQTELTAAAPQPASSSDIAEILEKAAPEHAAPLAGEAATPSEIPTPPAKVMAAVTEAASPEPVFAPLPAKMAAVPPEIPAPPAKVMAAVTETALPEPVFAPLPAEMAAVPPEIPAPQAEAAAKPPEIPAFPTARKKAVRETTTRAPEIAAPQPAGAPSPKETTAHLTARPAQAPVSARPPKIVMPPPPAVPPSPRSATPPSMAAAAVPPAASPPAGIVVPPSVAPVPGRQTPTPPADISAPITQPAIFRHLVDKPEENRLILLTRTLSGLVDLIIVILSGSATIFAVYILEGISVFDSVSIAHYLVLLLLTYFLYSVFFLSTGTQTIGMMLTYLCVTDAHAIRPKTSQILVRCIAFLLGFAAFGIGLLWSFFDRQARCMHDRLSRTKVVRISS